MRKFDTVVIGGGIIGCSIARLLAEAGQHVAVVEKSAPGQEASSAAAGMLAPSAEAEPDSPLFSLARASLASYPSWAAELLSETGIDVRYRTEPALLVFYDETERAEHAKSLEWQRARGVIAEEIGGKQLRELEPKLTTAAGAFLLSGDHQVDNRLLMHALVQSCRRHGVEFVLGESVVAVESNRGRANGVRLSRNGSDERIGAGQIVNAAGAWAGSIEGAPAPPIRPVKGQMLALESEEPVLRHVVRSHDVYVVPREGGRMLVGSTMEEAGFDKKPRAAALASLLNAAQRLCPALGEATLADCWAGLRPAAPDGLPILGPTEVEGYWLATGHFRNGILLAPITASLMSSWLVTAKPSSPVHDAFLPSRFRP